MCQEAPLAIKRGAVAMETLRKEEHDVGELFHLVPYVTVGDFPEAKRGDALPHLEGLLDGLVGLELAHLWGVVLYTEECVSVDVRKERNILFTHLGVKLSVTNVVHFKVCSLTRK